MNLKRGRVLADLLLVEVNPETETTILRYIPDHFKIRRTERKKCIANIIVENKTSYVNIVINHFNTTLLCLNRSKRLKLGFSCKQH